MWRDELKGRLKSNPIFDFSEDTDYVPAWDRIKPRHMVPAMEFALDIARQKLAEIKDNPKDPTFKNTVEALETCSELANYVFSVCSAYIPNTERESNAHDKAYDKLSDPYFDFFNDIFLDPDLFEKLQQIKASPAYKNVPRQGKFLFDMYEHTFEVSGARLPPAKRRAVRKLDKQIAKLGTKFQRNASNAAEKAIQIKDKAVLEGMPETVLDAATNRAAEKGKEGWVFTLSDESYQPFMRFCQNRQKRKAMWHAHQNMAARGRYDNHDTMVQLASLQQKRAHLIGNKNMAEAVLEETMAGDSETVQDFLEGIRDLAKPVAKKELAMISELARLSDGIEHLEAWDIPFYEERLREKTLGYTEEDLKPYFEVNRTMNALFDHLGALFNIEFEQDPSIPVYHEDVSAYRVINKRNGESMGVFYFDPFERENKPVGIAWDANVFSQGLFEGKVRRPIDQVVCKIPRGTEGNPALMTFYDLWVITHEMGHALHNIFSQCRYPSFAGYNTQSDFVEFPSQLMEEWIFEPEILGQIARHHKTGKTLPDEILESIQDSRQFGGGMRALRYARIGALDQLWAKSRIGSIKDTDEFERRHLRSYSVMPDQEEILSPHYSYGFGGGYEAVFYGYEWARQMRADVFDRVKQTGNLYNRRHMDRIRAAMAKGGSEFGGPLLKGMTGHPVRVRPHLKEEGIACRTFRAQTLIDEMQARADERNDNLKTRGARPAAAFANAAKRLKQRRAAPPALRPF